MDSRLKIAVRTIIELLVAKKYDDIVRLTAGQRLDSASINNAINEYGRTLVSPPESIYENLDVVPITNVRFPQWSVRANLWTAEEGRSDLSIELTLTKLENTYAVELDDIHVL